MGTGEHCAADAGGHAPRARPAPLEHDGGGPHWYARRAAPPLRRRAAAFAAAGALAVALLVVAATTDGVPARAALVAAAVSDALNDKFLQASGDNAGFLAKLNDVWFVETHADRPAIAADATRLATSMQVGVALPPPPPPPPPPARPPARPRCPASRCAARARAGVAR
jgi:hypothetical protein